ncbi:hect-domain (ubiquitin-transferase) domain-containing, partial [Cystoisospora suis]
MRLFFLLLLMEFAASVLVPRVADSVFAGDSLSAIYSRQAERCRSIQNAALDCFSLPRPKPLRPVQQVVLPPLAEYLGQALAFFYEACRCPADCLCCGDAPLGLPWSEPSARQKDVRYTATGGDIFETKTGNHPLPPPDVGVRVHKTASVSADASSTSCTPASSSPFSAFSTGKDEQRSLAKRYFGLLCSCERMDRLHAALFNPTGRSCVRGFPFVSLGRSSSPLCLTTAIRELLLHMQTLQELRGLDGNFPHCPGVPSALFLFEFLQRLSAMGSVKKPHFGSLLRQVLEAGERWCTGDKSQTESADTTDPEGRPVENFLSSEGVRETSGSERSHRIQVDFWKTLPLVDEDVQQLFIPQHLDLRQDLKPVLDRLLDTRKWLRQECFRTARHAKRMRLVSSSTSAATVRGTGRLSDTVSESSRQGERESDRRLLALVSPPSSDRRRFWGSNVFRGSHKRTPDSSARSAPTLGSVANTPNRPGGEDSDGRHTFEGDGIGAESSRACCRREATEQLWAGHDTAGQPDTRSSTSPDAGYLVREGPPKLALEVIDEESEERLLSRNFCSDGPRQNVKVFSSSKEFAGDGGSQVSTSLSSSSLHFSSPRGPCCGVPPSHLSCVSSCYSSNLFLSTATHSFQSCRPYKTAFSASLAANSLPLPSTVASPDTVKKALDVLLRRSPKRRGAADSGWRRDISPADIEREQLRGSPVRGLRHRKVGLEACGDDRVSDTSAHFKLKRRARSEDYTRAGLPFSSRAVTKKRKCAVPVFVPIAVRTDHRELLRRLFLRWQTRQREQFGVTEKKNGDERHLRAVAGIAKLPGKSYFMDDADGEEDRLTPHSEKVDACLSTRRGCGAEGQCQEESRHLVNGVCGALEAFPKSGCTNRSDGPVGQMCATMEDGEETYFARDLAVCFQEDVRVIKLAPHATGAVVSFCSPPCQLAPGDQLTVYALPRTLVATSQNSPCSVPGAAHCPWIPVVEMSSYFVDRLWHAVDYAPSFRACGGPIFGNGTTQGGATKALQDVMLSSEEWRGGPFALGSLAAAIRHGLLDAVDALAFIPQSVVDCQVTPLKRQS